jgi:hypothetical protein
MEFDSVLREELLALLRGGNAHMPLEDAVANFPEAAMNSRPPNVPYTPWHLLEHLRRTQNDILEFIRDPSYVSPQWPVGYWPDPEAKTDPAGWEETLKGFSADLADLEAMVQDMQVSLTAPIPHAPGYTVFREILLVADHNAYHIGEFAILRQVMGTWGDQG